MIKKTKEKLDKKVAQLLFRFLVSFSEKKPNLFFFPSSLMTIIKLQPQ